MIKTSVKQEDVLRHKTDCLVIFCLEEAGLTGALKTIDQRLDGAVQAAFQAKRFEGKPNQTLLLNSRKALGADNVLLAGLGKKKELTPDRVCQASGTAAKLAEKNRFAKISYFVPGGLLPASALKGKKPGYDAGSAAAAEGALLALYHFDAYKSKENDEEPPRVREVGLVAEPKTAPASLRKAVERAQALAAAVCAARDLIAHPSNTATPRYLADHARRIARKHPLTCRVLGKNEMKKLGMGALLGVAQGSQEPPALIVLEYRGGRKTEPPVVIVGKGITFDTGGISLKPPANMDEMKMDMSGGGVTLGTLQAAAALKLPVNVIGLVPATENMPSGTAIKPGDVLKSMSGKTIEVLNTDAEGRLVLADALAYAARYKPQAVIDLATLTGAVVVALGHSAAAVLGNDETLVKKLITSGESTGERLWQLPLWEEHEKAMKSQLADLKNIAGPGVGAGTITGAAFLKAFAGDQPWAHLDIAGTAWGDEKPYVPKGPSGFGVRLLVDYLEHVAAGRKRKTRKK